MKYLGIDYGAKRIGLAVSSEGIAFPRGTIPNDSVLLAALKEVVEKERIDSIVVGDTRSWGGTANIITKDAEAFIERLQKEIGVPVVSAGEAGSSIEAARLAPENEKHDDAAAAIILQRYLEMHQGKVE